MLALWGGVAWTMQRGEDANDMISSFLTALTTSGGFSKARTIPDCGGKPQGSEKELPCGNPKLEYRNPKQIRICEAQNSKRAIDSRGTGIFDIVVVRGE